MNSFTANSLPIAAIAGAVVLILYGQPAIVWGWFLALAFLTAVVPAGKREK